MKKTLSLIAILAAFGANGQTVHVDSANMLKYVNITPVRWMHNEPMCDRLYLLDYKSNLTTQSTAMTKVGYLAAPNTHPIFVDGPIYYTFADAQYDSVRSHGGPYIFGTIARINNLTITE